MPYHVDYTPGTLLSIYPVYTTNNFSTPLSKKKNALCMTMIDPTVTTYLRLDFTIMMNQ